MGDPYLRGILDYTASLKLGAGKKTFTFIKKVLTDQQNIVMTYGEYLRRQGVQQGIQQGVQQGIQQGIQQGVQQGVQQGIQQGVQQGIQQGVQQGIQQGVQQGIQQGVQQGIQQGVQQGRQEGMQTRSLEIAKNMLHQLGLDIEVVEQATGLSRQELACL